MPLDRLHQTFAWLSDRLLDLAGIVLFLMMVHVASDVAGRYFLNSPIPGTLEIVSYYYMVPAVFLPLATIELTRGSIAVDLFFMMMSDPMKRASVFLVLVLSTVVYAGLAYVTAGDALRSFSRSEVVMGPVTILVWPTRVILPLSFALGGLVSLWHLLRFIALPEARAELILPPDTEEAV